MGEENVGKILSAPPKVSSYVVYSKTDYSNICRFFSAAAFFFC